MHELLGWVFALSTRLALPLFKMALWRCQHLHWNWYYLYLPSKYIQFLKFYCWKSNNSLDHWENDVYMQDPFLSNWFLFGTFSWGKTMKIPKNFLGLCPKPPADYSDHFLKIVKKTDQLIFLYFDHWYWNTLTCWR